MEKYVIPGAAFFLFVLLLPQAILRGLADFQHLELVPALIACFVFGHLMESIRLYRLVPGVATNWRTIYAKDLGNHIVERLAGRRNKQRDVDSLAMHWDEIGDNVLTGAERSELAWNLVRWQKMISLAIIFRLCALEWAVLALLHWLKFSSDTNPFAIPTRIIYLADWITDSQAALSNFALAVVSSIFAVWLKRTGLDRQKKSNRKRLAYIIKHADDIEPLIASDPDQQFLQPRVK